MFRPISFNVIRQALEWHEFPIPALRLMSFSDRDPDVVAAEYLATWEEYIMPQKYFVPDAANPRQGIDIFREDLQACFCDDVQVRELRWSDAKEQMSAILYVRVEREALAMAAPFTR